MTCDFDEADVGQIKADPAIGRLGESNEFVWDVRPEVDGDGDDSGLRVHEDEVDSG